MQQGRGNYDLYILLPCCEEKGRLFALSGEYPLLLTLEPDRLWGERATSRRTGERSLRGGNGAAFLL